MKITLTFFTVLLHAALHAATPTEDANALALQWAQNRLLGEQAVCPFSFGLGGRAECGGFEGWKKQRVVREVDAQRREHTLTWTDDRTGLQARCVVVTYADLPAVEWTLWLKNTGSRDTPMIENLQGLDTRFEREAEGEFVLHGLRGDTCVAESFRPYVLTLGPDAVKRCSPPSKGDKVSGKSSDGPDGWPYFNLQQPGGGVMLAVGWPGQWEATFTRDHERGLRVKAGQQLTHLVLRPGEEIRTPLIALLFWQGEDVVRAQNLWRAWYLAHVLPRVAGVPQPPTTQIQVDGALANWARVQAFLDAGIKPDICWRDAGGANTWYPSSGGPFTEKKIWLNTGTWEVDPVKYPQGFKPYSDKVRANGMQFLLWFEPERVGDPNSWLGKNHPEWLMPGNSAGSVLNLGDADALKALNAIVHPAIGNEINSRVMAQVATDHVVVLDIPLLTENPREGLQGKIVVDVPEATQVERLVRYRGFDEADARARIGKQATREQRLEGATWVVDNSGDLDALTPQIDVLWAALTALPQLPSDFEMPQPKRRDADQSDRKSE